MSRFTQIMIGGIFAALFGLPLAASHSGWGLASETDGAVVSASSEYCPPGRRRPDGTCARTVRSYYFGRSYVGGGPRFGK